MDKIPITFQAQIYQHSPMENSGFTACRARVFYTGLNRNGSYMDENFAKILINSASGCPVVGLWDTEKRDFTDHSPSDRKRAYGFIPENPNFTWESGYDYDGVERQYASFDIVLWTKAFAEANEIITHPLSMELNPDTINGEFKVINGEYCFYFTSAEMLGVCVLGYDVEPCFEGARFINIEEANEFKRLFQLDKQQALLAYNNKGETSMNEEKETLEEKETTPVEEFTQIRNDDIEDSVVEPTEETQEVAENFENEEENKEVTPETEPELDFKAEAEKFAEQVAELEKVNKDFKVKIDELEQKISELERKNFALEEFKENKIKEEKQKILNQYTEVLSEEEIANINIDEFSIENLNDKLAAMAYRKIASKPTDFQLINTDIVDSYNDIDSIVKKYKEN